MQEASKSAQLRVRAEQENVSGVMLPTFAMYTEGGNGNYSRWHIIWIKSLNGVIIIAFEFTGLGRGGQHVQRSKEVYRKAVETLIELASLQVRFYPFVIPSCTHINIDCICDLGRGDQGNQSSCECYWACHHSPLWEYHQVYHFWAWRIRQRRILPTEKGAGQKEGSCSCWRSWTCQG